MDTQRWWVAGAAILVLSFAVVLKARGIMPVGPPETRYQTHCAVVESRSVDGYVTNLTREPMKLRGEVRFNFIAAGTMTRPQILVQAERTISGGETARVARAEIIFPLNSGETCYFDASAALVTP
jgi:hypothetical protein